MIQLAAVLMLPMVFGINGIWCAVAVAEAVTLVITITFLIKNKNVPKPKPRDDILPWFHPFSHLHRLIAGCKCLICSVTGAPLPIKQAQKTVPVHAQPRPIPAYRRTVSENRNAWKGFFINTLKIFFLMIIISLNRIPVNCIFIQQNHKFLIE